MKTFSVAEVAKITDRNTSSVSHFARKNGFSGRRWTQEDIDEYQKYQRPRFKRTLHIVSDADLSPRLLAIRNKYKNGVPDNEVFALANSIEQELYEENEV